jgi:hypothetical protein
MFFQRGCKQFGNHSKVTPRQELADNLASVKLHCFAGQGAKTPWQFDARDVPLNSLMLR